ncbi:hypothetical protein [Conexibacter sp. SYSU D00693]|uniref:hypothetical protein n=1 Tax=Conexibacter sp. SYSU D00693 TaxID=2812560 RepID=UPI00196A81CC|nr:hypothetical protein [Conexibacter sp. SYSU D00693]
MRAAGGMVALGLVLSACAADDQAGRTGGTGAIAGTQTAVLPTAPTREDAARRVARRYVRALRRGDASDVCATSSRAARGKAGGPCDLRRMEPLTGPVPKVGVPQVDGRTAYVAVDRGAAPMLRLTLVREQGRWGVDAVLGR